MTDFRALSQSIVNAGQYRLPPMDTLRLGRVIGYDPGYDATYDASGKKHKSPTLSVTVGGSEQVLHGIHFHNSYSPILGDTVWLSWPGEDIWVVGSMAKDQDDFAPNVVGFRRSVQTVVGHGDFTSKYTTAFTAPLWWKQYQPVKTTDSYAFTVNINVLPNRLYKADILVSFKVTGTASVTSIGIITPDGLAATAASATAEDTPHTVWQNTTTAGTTYTVSASTTWWDNTPAHYAQPGSWTKRHPENKASWGLAVLVANTATVVTLDETKPQRLVITDLGVKS